MSAGDEFIHLTPDQGSRIRELARRSGRPEAELVREALERYLAARAEAEPGGSETCYDIAERLGLVGGLPDLPADLSTNKDYFEGFGRG